MSGYRSSLQTPSRCSGVYVAMLISHTHRLRIYAVRPYIRRRILFLATVYTCDAFVASQTTREPFVCQCMQCCSHVTRRQQLLTRCAVRFSRVVSIRPAVREVTARYNTCRLFMIQVRYRPTVDASGSDELATTSCKDEASLSRQV